MGDLDHLKLTFSDLAIKKIIQLLEKSSVRDPILGMSYVETSTVSTSDRYVLSRNSGWDVNILDRNSLPKEALVTMIVISGFDVIVFSSHLFPKDSENSVINFSDASQLFFFEKSH